MTPSGAYFNLFSTRSSGPDSIGITKSLLCLQHSSYALLYFCWQCDWAMILQDCKVLRKLSPIRPWDIIYTTFLVGGDRSLLCHLCPTFLSSHFCPHRILNVSTFPLWTVISCLTVPKPHTTCFLLNKLMCAWPASALGNQSSYGPQIKIKGFSCELTCGPLFRGLLPCSTLWFLMNLFSTFPSSHHGVQSSVDSQNLLKKWNFFP